MLIFQIDCATFHVEFFYFTRTKSSHNCTSVNTDHIVYLYIYHANIVVDVFLILLRWKAQL